MIKKNSCYGGGPAGLFTRALNDPKLAVLATRGIALTHSTDQVAGEAILAEGYVPTLHVPVVI